MHYVDVGDQQAAPVLMVHGNPTWSWYYRHLVQALARDQAGQPARRAIAIDHIGCGLSDKPRDLPYSLDLRIDHLASLVQQLDLRDIHLVVHDWGGAIGLGAALTDLSRYRSFTLLNTGAFPPPFFPWRIRVCRTPGLGRIAVQGFNGFARAANVMATAQRGGLPPEVRRGLLAPYDNWHHRRAIYEFVTDIPTRTGQPTMQRLVEIESGLSRLKNHPVQLLWGMQDWCFRPACLRRFEALLPHARTHEYPGAGHYVLEDARAEVIRDVQEFLQHENPVSV